MRIVCLSDTHGLQNNFKVPEGDLLIHAGDFCNTGSERDVQKFAKWFCHLPHRHKVVVAGNHDWYFQEQPELARLYLEPEVIYLRDSGCEIEGLKFWGSPWQPWFMDWAFNLPRNGTRLREVWNQIPIETDILVTHSPAHGTLDSVNGGPPLGCEELAIRIPAVKPRLHVFGHIHSGYGTQRVGETLHVNASICTEAYRPTNPAIVVDVDARGRTVPLKPE